MTPDQISDALRLHDMWLRGVDGGQRANLSDADLSCAYLRGANLGSAYLRGAYLGSANLSGANLGSAYLGGADLRDADLRDADLGGANLRGSDLRGAIGCVRLPVGDPRGHDAAAIWHDDHWVIAAGCRWLTVAESRAHWGEQYDGDRHIGDRYLYALDWLETSAEAGEAMRRAMEAGR